MTFTGECRRKVRFGQKPVAVARASELGMRAYRCTWCNGYHLTSDLDGASTPQARKPRRLIPTKKERRQ